MFFFFKKCNCSVLSVNIRDVTQTKPMFEHVCVSVRMCCFQPNRNPALHWCALCLTHPPKNLPFSELKPVHKIRVTLLVWPYITVMLVFVFHCLSFDWSFVSYIIVLFLVVLNWFSWHMPAENWVRSSANHLLMFTCGWLEAFVTAFVQGNSTLVSRI